MGTHSDRWKPGCPWLTTRPALAMDGGEAPSRTLWSALEAAVSLDARVTLVDLGTAPSAASGSSTV